MVSSEALRPSSADIAGQEAQSSREPIPNTIYKEDVLSKVDPSVGGTKRIALIGEVISVQDLVDTRADDSNNVLLSPRIRSRGDWGDWARKSKSYRVGKEYVMFHRIQRIIAGVCCSGHSLYPMLSFAVECGISAAVGL